MRVTAFILIVVVSGLFSCGNASDKDQVNDSDAVKVQKRMVNVNKIIAHNESDEIDAYIKRHDWQVKKTGTGLRYMIYKSGNGIQAAAGKEVNLSYTLGSIKGENYYSSKEDGKPLNFVIDKAELPHGLQEGVTFMRVGDKAKIIVPAHLGFGMLGDGKKINGSQILVYDVELLEVK